MLNNLAQELHKKYPELAFDSSFVRGYSEEEIKKIERLYDIEVPSTSQLYSFLKNMGRCSGGLFGDDTLYFYVQRMTVGGHINVQYLMREELLELGLINDDSEKIFFVSRLAETQYFFLKTKSSMMDMIYHYNENTEEINETGITFYQHIDRILSYGHSEYTCSKEVLIRFSSELVDF
ncbi:hypothetical protein VQ643_15000 [Pseudomonas sp. F1_0610]|uniref:hypothetical protein n=1 Tax=Pseudomonas sp. F1_0610 TaxID=3114284 RepID=UPI0039C0CFAB